MSKRVGSSVVAAVILIALSGCTEPTPERASASRAPALGSADGSDAADRDCQIVLRELARPAAAGGYETECIDGYCWFVWAGTLDVSAAALAEGAMPGVLYQSGSDPTWWSVGAEPIDGASPGYQRFAFRFSEHTVSPGMSMTSLMRTRIEVAPYLLTAAGGRLFDHNRNPGDFDNYVLVADNAWSVQDDPAVCAATAEEPTVALQSAQVATRVDYPAIMRTTLRGVVRVTGVGRDDSVTIHYQIREGNNVARDWTTVEAQPLFGGLWEFETPMFEGPCPHYCPRHVFQFAIEYQLDGEILWDNNGGAGVDYRLANDLGGSVPGDWPPPAILDRPIQLTWAEWDPDYPSLRGEILLDNLAYEKQVDLVYSTDGWATVREAPAQFSRFTRDDREYWRFRFDVPEPGAELRFAIRYRVGGETFWDNHLGLDYSVPTPLP